MKIVNKLLFLMAALCSASVMNADEGQPCKVTVLPEPICRLRIPLKLGFQLGIPARDNSAFYAECFSTDALEREIARLNERVEIGLLVSHEVNKDNGEITVTLSNQSVEMRGITLRTGYLLRDRRYLVRARGRRILGARGVTLRVRHEHGEDPLAEDEQTISRWRSESELEWGVVPQLSGFHLCTFMVSPGSSVALRGFSMLPEDSLSIWRRESIDVLRSAGAGSFRWPVVDGMDFYNWYDGVGARSVRVPVQPGKTGLKHHDFGTAEYVDFCRTVGAEPLICVPLYTPGCSDPRIRDLDTAVQIAADWVAYCNADDDHPLAVLREKNGIGEPLRVRHWELVAPPSGPLLPSDMIASACLRSIHAMKEEDPRILVGVALSDAEPSTLAELLRQAGLRLDFVSGRAPEACAMIREYNRVNGTAVMFAGTTLRGECGEYADTLLKGLGELEGEKRARCTNWYSSLGLANAAVRRLELCRDGPVCLPYYAEQVLGLDHGTTGLSTDIGLLSAMIGRFPAVEPLKCTVEAKEGEVPLRVYPAWTEGASVLVVFVYNPQPEPRTLLLDVGLAGKKFSFYIMDQLSGEMHSEAGGEILPVLRTQKAGGVGQNGTFECPIGSSSFSRILIKE